MDNSTQEESRVDTLMIRIVVIALMAAVLISFVGSLILSIYGKEIPAALIALGAAACGALPGFLVPTPYAAEIKSNKEERNEINRRLDNRPEDILITIQLGLNQLNEYYIINKGQARNSFRFSIFAVIAGLLTIADFSAP